MGLARANRLKGWRDFQAVYERGDRHHGRYLTLRCFQGIPPDAPPQMGIAVGKRVSKKAVVRNQIKRRLRLALRHLLPQINGGYQLVINVKPGAISCEYEHFLRELEQLLIRTEAWHGYKRNRIL